MKNNLLNIALIVSTILIGCDTSENESDPSQSFFKVYDNNAFDASYIPIDIEQTSDEGFLILSSRRISSSNFTGVNLIKVDKNGDFVKEIELDEDYVNPVNQLVKIDNQYHFIAMDPTSLQAILFTVNDSINISSITPIGGISYPMYVQEDESNLLLLSYNNQDKTSVLSIVSTDGSVGQSQGYSIGAGADTEAPIIAHFNRTGKQLPFFAGKALGGSYFFNGFYNYTLSLVFTTFGDEPRGVVQGQQDDGGLSASIPVSAGIFAASMFIYGDNYILPQVGFNTTGISIVTDSLTRTKSNSFPELVDDAPVVLKLIETGSEQIILYGSNTKSGQIILMAYDVTSGTLTGTKYLGSTYPYQIAGFTTTADGGLAVVGNTSVAGRFDRICLFKLSPDELASLAN